MKYKEYIHRLSQLVALPSVSSTSVQFDQPNEAVIDLLANWAMSAGMTVEKMPVFDKPGKYNLMATKGKGPGGLILSGHSDTVPFNAELWQTDPFKLTEKEDQLFGLGATDMKGFFPVALEAITNITEQELTAPIILLATADEESSMDGVRALVAAGRPKARAAIIGEPTMLKPVHAHKGVMMESIQVIGRSGHSSDPTLGNNALNIATDILLWLKKLQQQFQQTWHDPKFKISYPTINLGCIHGGDNPNRICGEVELHFDVRTMPGQAHSEVRKHIQDYCQEMALATHSIINYRPLIHGVPSFEQSTHSELVQLCCQLTEHQPQAVTFGTEAPFLQQLGLEAVVMGPGSIDVAHQPNEYIALDQIAPAVDIIERLIQHYCVGEV